VLVAGCFNFLTSTKHQAPSTQQPVTLIGRIQLLLKKNNISASPEISG
jgi:hypothetical protein